MTPTGTPGDGSACTLDDCAVVVVNYGSHQLIQENFAPLSRLERGPNVIVVDNYTTDREQRSVLSLCARNGWSAVTERENVGFGAGVNHGVDRAVKDGAEKILLLNPDASIQFEDLVRLRDRVQQYPMTMVAPTIRTPAGQVWFAGAVVDLRNGTIRALHGTKDPGPDEIPWISGACVMMSRELWSMIGGFDENYFLYWEDVDLSYRAQQLGAIVEVLQHASATHSQGGTQLARTRRSKSNTYYYYMARGRMLFAGRHISGTRRARWMLRAPRYAWDVVLHGGRRQLLHSWSPLVAVARGTSSGFVAAYRASTTDKGHDFLNPRRRDGSGSLMPGCGSALPEGPDCSALRAPGLT